MLQRCKKNCNNFFKSNNYFLNRLYILQFYNMLTIHLEGLEFFAYHGYYKQERQIGNRYGVDVVVEIAVPNEPIEDKLPQTVNYETLYEIVKTEMKVPSKLLEHIADRIANKILEHFPQVLRLTVNISKFNPPIGGVCERAKVCLKKER